ncbi:MAG: PilZ domain-containing protein [Desulfuromonadaceae bacterium]
MDERRIHSRLKFELQCHLKGNASDTYKVLLGDISLSGALILVNNDTPFQSGDFCELMLGGMTETDSIKHYCKVVRADSGSIGLEFQI